MIKEKSNKIKSLNEKLGPDWEGKIVLEEEKVENGFIKSFVSLRRYEDLVAEFNHYCDKSYKAKWKTYIGQKQLRMLTKKLYPAKEANVIIRTITCKEPKKMPLKDALRIEDKIFSLGVGNEDYSFWWQESEYGLYTINFSSYRKNRKTLETVLKSTMPKRDWEQIVNYLDKILKYCPD